jgi:GT2 family glycosyltransferase
VTSRDDQAWEQAAQGPEFRGGGPLVTEPLVPAIISTYNRPQYLRQAAASVISQTLTDFELLICDDASAPAADVPAAIPDDPRVQYVPASRNLGTATNNARGYDLAQGRYVAHLDDDDLWHADYLRRLVEALECRPHCSLAFCNQLVIDATGEPDLDVIRWSEEEWRRADLVEGVYQPFWDLAIVRRAIPTSHASVIRREMLNNLAGLREAGYTWDLFLTYQAARRGHGAYFIPERLARYRVHETQQTSALTRLATYRGLTYCDRTFLADPELGVDRSVVSARLARVTAYWALALLRLGRPDEARTVLRDARPSPWIAAARSLTRLPAACALARLVTGAGAFFREIRSRRLRGNHRAVFGDRRLRFRGIRVGPPTARRRESGGGGG